MLTPNETTRWISLDPHPQADLGVFAFRRRVELSRVPQSLEIAVSADQRYKLFVNGKLVGFGPQRGDLRHWIFDTYELGPFLKSGSNSLVALVWNFGRWAPMAQISARTGFVAWSNDPRISLDTPEQWEVARVPQWSFEMMHAGVGEFYIDVGPGEIIRADPELARLHSFDQRSSERWGWTSPHVICAAELRGACSGGSPWMLLPRSLPPMLLERFKGELVRRHGFEGDESVGEDRSLLRLPLPLSPGEKVVLDFGELLCAYPKLKLRSTEGASVKITYDEALWSPDGVKGNRDEVGGKHPRGYQDCFEIGGDPFEFEPLWWRTFRYLTLEADQPAELLGVEAVETGYPMNVESKFTANDPWVDRIWQVGIRTARRCAGETYFDCPYYEQLQYVGDTRIQALLGYYLGRDRALQRNAVETLGWSLMENGLTQSRYPSRQCQIIPPFSLWWVMMVWDQLLHDDPSALPDFVSFQTLSRILGRFRKLQQEPGQFWPFGDWVPGWRWGVPPGGLNALMHQVTLEMATTAAERIKGFLEVGETKRRGSKFWQDWAQTGGSPLATSARSGVTSEPSEHAEALFRCHLAMYRDDPDPWPAEALAQANAAKCTYYFSYYKHLAMFGRPTEELAERDEISRSSSAPTTYPFDYLEELQPWKEMIEDGLTTFAETPEPTRSDCHAWSAHPLLGFFQVVAGVTSLAPGWKKAQIMPHPGSLRKFEAQIAHPMGELTVRFEDRNLEIDSPVPYRLRWKGIDLEIESGKQSFRR